MRVTARDRAGIGLCVAASALGVVWARGPHASHASTPLAVVSAPAPAPVTVSWPSTIILPDQLAQAIGQARVNTAAGCHPHKAQAWAEIDENGHVLGMYAACASGTVKS